MDNGGTKSQQPAVVDHQRNNKYDTCVCKQMGKHSKRSQGSSPISPLDNSIKRPFSDHSQRDPDACPEHHKSVGKKYKDSVVLQFVHIRLPKMLMDAKKCAKMVYIRIMMKRIGMAVVGKSMLVLPQNRIAQEGHAPNCNVIYKGSSTSCEMSGVVPQGTNQPSKNSEEKTAEDISLQFQYNEWSPRFMLAFLSVSFDQINVPELT